MSLKNWIGILICNLIWSVHPVMGKWLLNEVNPPQAAWLRYSSALLSYVIFVVAFRFFRRSSPGNLTFFFIPKNFSDGLQVMTLGLATFCFSPLMQISGLSHSLATENSVIVAIEPLLTALFAWLLLREKVTLVDLVGFTLALLGFSFLTRLSFSQMIMGQGHFSGNLLILFSLIGEAVYTVLGKKLTIRHPPFAIFGTALAVGVLFLALGLSFFESPSQLVVFQGLSWRALGAIFWLGPLGTTVGYLFVMLILSEVSILALALLLFMQPLAGALWGYLFLGDQLSPIQNFGGGLILLAVLLPNAMRLKKRPIV